MNELITRLFIEQPLASPGSAKWYLFLFFYFYYYLRLLTYCSYSEFCIKKKTFSLVNWLPVFLMTTCHFEFSYFNIHNISLPVTGMSLAKGFNMGNINWEISHQWQGQTYMGGGLINESEHKFILTIQRNSEFEKRLGGNFSHLCKSCHNHLIFLGPISNFFVW